MAVKQGWGSGGLEIDLLVLVLDHFRHRLVLHAGRVPLVIVVHLPTLLRVPSGAWSTHRWRSIDPWKKIGNWHVKKHVLGRDSEFTMRPRCRATDQMTATLGEKYRFGSKFAWNRIGRSCFAIGKRFVLRRGDQESTCAFFESRIIICDALVCV